MSAHATRIQSLPSIRRLTIAAQQVWQWLEWEQESLEDFHRYGQLFGKPGNNVYGLVLEDALRHRGLTLEQLRAKKKEV